MKRVFFIAIFSLLLFVSGNSAWAQSKEVMEGASGAEFGGVGVTIGGEITRDLVKAPKESISDYERVLRDQDPGNIWLNPVKHAIRRAAESNVSLETIILLLLLPLVATIIAGARHVIGLRGFGILLPAALTVVFLAIGPVLGIGLFLIIVAVSTLFRVALRRTKVKLQYLPRIALILWAVVLGVLGVLFAAPIVPGLDIPEVSVFPVLILVLLAEDFTKIQLGKSITVAVNLTTETLILALVSFTILSLRPVQYFALLNPEIVLLSVAVLDFLLGRYVGLRLVEYWRFRKLAKS